MKLLTIALIVLLSFGAFFYFFQSQDNNTFQAHTLKKGEKPPKIFQSEDKGPKKGEPGFVPEKKPSEWFFAQRAYPHDEIKLESFRQALHQAQQDKADAQLRDREALWEFAGPTNIGGRITDFAIHPDYPDIIYAGSASGGILKSTDGGDTWDAIFDDVAIAPIGALAIDPDNPNIIYAGTGESNASSYSFFGLGMYKSTDAGETWDYIGLDDTRYIGRIAIDPDDTDKIFVAACGKLFGKNDERGIYRSTNGGEEWEKVLFVSDSTAAVDVAINPENPNIIYASMWERIRHLRTRKSGGWTTGLWKSTNGGDTWEEMLTGLPKGENVGRPGISVCASNPNVIYAIYADHPGYFLGVYKTVNGGDLWTQCSSSGLGDMFSSFGWFFGNIRVNPSNPNQVYALGVSLHRSDNGGGSWVTLADYSNDDEIHVDHHAMWINPETGYIVEGNDGGIYFSSNDGDVWIKSMNLPNSQFYAIAIDESNPHRLYGGTQDNGTLRTWDGSIDNWDHILGGDGFYCLVHPNNSNHIWAESQWGNLYKSTNGGNYWDWATNGINGNDRTNWSTPVVMDPNNPDIMYYGSHRLYKSTNGADYWDTISDDLTDGQGTITTISVAQTTSDVIYVGTDDGNVWMTNDGGDSWTDASMGLPDRWVTRVAVSPIDESVAYVTFSGFRWEEEQPHVFRTIFSGAYWEDITGNLPDAPVNALALDPRTNPETLYVGTDFGVYYSTNLGLNWAVLGTNLPICPVLDLKLHYDSNKLVAGTHGRSMFTFDLNHLTKITDNTIADIPSKAQLSQNYPNPFNPNTTIPYQLPNAQKVKLSIYNSSGQLVKILEEGQKNAGSHKAQWNGVDENGQPVSSGTYIYRLQGEDWQVTKKMQLMK